MYVCMSCMYVCMYVCAWVVFVSMVHMYVCMYVCNHICIRRVLLLSSGCPSWYEEGKVKNQTLTKPMPRTQRNPSILSERIKLGKSYDVWLANQAPEMKHRLKRYLWLYESVDHGGLRSTMCCPFPGNLLFARCLCLYSHYMYLCKHCGHFLFHYNYVCMYADSMLLPPTNYLCMYVLFSQFYIATHSTRRMSLYVIVFRCIPQYFIVWHGISRMSHGISLYVCHCFQLVQIYSTSHGRGKDWATAPNQILANLKAQR